MAKRIASSTARWSFIAENLLSEDVPKVNLLKSLSDKYARQIIEKPAELPKIDWNYYKAKISQPGMVESFQKNYEGLKIPFPSDQGELSATESSNAKLIQDADAKLKEFLKKIEENKLKLVELDKMMKYSEMTVEEFILARPDQDYVNNPQLWPEGFEEPVVEKEEH